MEKDKYKEKFNFSNLIITMYVLKVKFDFSKKTSGFLILVSNLQPLFFLFEFHSKNLSQHPTVG